MIGKAAILLGTAALVVAVFGIYTFGWRDDSDRPPSPHKTKVIASRLETLRAVRLIVSTRGFIADEALPIERIEPFLPGRWLVKHPRPQGISGSYCMLIDPTKYHATNSQAGYEYVPCEIGH